MTSKKPEDDGFIKPAAAIAAILHYVGSEYDAKQVIADGLHSGRIRCVAEYLWQTNVGDIREDWVPRKHGDFLYSQDVDIEPDFWVESKQWPDDLQHWRWEKSEFVLFTSDEYADRLERIYVKNVRLQRKDVLALVGRSSRGGGRKPDRDRWSQFWINILYDFTPDFDWTQFDSPQQLKQAFLSCNVEEGAFSDNNVDSAIKHAWEGLVQRAARERLTSNTSPVSDRLVFDPRD